MKKIEDENNLDRYKYRLYDEDFGFYLVEERSEMKCKECKIIRGTKEKFLNHLNSRRHLRITEINKN